MFCNWFNSSSKKLNPEKYDFVLENRTKIILDCFQASSIALIVAASLMLHQPEKYITEWKNMKKSDTVKEMQINEVGENGIERKLKTNEISKIVHFGTFIHGLY